MKCKDLKELLSAYADDELSGPQKKLVEDHLEGCIDCRAALVDYRVAGERLVSLKTMRAAATETVASPIIERSSRKRGPRWVRPSLAVIPVAIVMVALLVLQPWVPASGPQAVIAQAIYAAKSITSYRTSGTPGITITGKDGVMDNTHNAVFEEFAFPDRVHLVLTVDGGQNDYIYIGDKLYYNTTTFNILMSSMPGHVPNQDDTVQDLETIKGLRQLPDEVIDGVNCFHFKGKDKSNPDTVDIWIGKDDYLVRQKIRINYNTGKVVETTKYFDFNQPIDIEAPVSPSGELLPGWQVTDVALPTNSTQLTYTTTTDNAGNTTTMVSPQK